MVDARKIRGSVHSYKTSLYTNTKLYLIPYLGDSSSKRSYIDVSFLSNIAGPIELEIDFKTRNNLAYCLIDF